MSEAEPHKPDRVLRVLMLQAQRLRHEADGLDAVAAEVALLQESATNYSRLKFYLERQADTQETTTPDDLRRILERVETGEQP